MKFIHSLQLFCIVCTFGINSMDQLSQQIKEREECSNLFDLLPDEIVLEIVYHAFDTPTALQQTYDVLTQIDKRFHYLVNTPKIFNKRKEMLQQLIFQDKNSWSEDIQYLRVAIRHNFTKIITAELKKKPQLGKSKGAVYLAAGYGTAETINILYSFNPKIIEFRRFGKNTPLHTAAWKGNKSAVIGLLKNNADIYATDSKNMRPITYAAIMHHFDILKILSDREKEMHACKPDFLN